MHTHLPWTTRQANPKKHLELSLPTSYITSSLSHGPSVADDIYAGFLRDLAKYGLDTYDCVMVMMNTAANMNKFGKQMQYKLNIDHRLYIDRVF
jgi:hypothetical protein